MNPNRNPNVTVVGVPMDLGADRRGAELGPDAVRSAGLMQCLGGLGYHVTDEGNVIVQRGRQGAVNTLLKHVEEIARVSGKLCEQVSRIREAGRFPLVLGGDHSTAIGTLAGLTRGKERLGLLWFDAHGDVNTADTSPSGNIHGMALAAALGYGDSRLTSIGHPRSDIHPGNVALIGTRSLDPGEKHFVKQQGITVFSMRDIDRLGITDVLGQALQIVSAGTDGVHLSFDLDVLDPISAPGVSTPVPGGLTLREGLLAMELLSEANVLISAEFVEMNPLADQADRTVQAAARLIAVLFGERTI
ncbi:arginase [Paenibacillus sp. y28]|uniref:arginase n=1 Tax=Paenibacillus sp. y28 TaxID=3129110 RepID=UPI0030164AFE